MSKKEEKFIEKLNKENEIILGFQEYEKKIADLEAKLAEKEKEIAYLTKQVKKFNNEAQKYFEDAYCNDFHNQDKISFAVEQLEKLKVELHIIHTNGYLKAIDEEIDDQINELKKVK